MKPYALLFFTICAFHSVEAQNTYDARFVEYTGLRYVCDDGFTPVVKILNEGSATMTTCVVETWKNGLMVNTFDWILAVPALTGEVRQPALPEIADALPNDTYEFHIVDVNGFPDEGSDGNEITVLLDDEPVIADDNTVLVKVQTGSVQSDFSWQIKNELAQVVASGGPYNTTLTMHDTLISLDPYACYQLAMSVIGEAGFPMGSAALESNGDEFYFIPGEMIGAQSYQGFRTGGPLNVPSFASADQLLLFPNPTSGELRIRGDLDVTEIRIHDASGRSLGEKRINGNADPIIDLSNFGSGLYFMTMTTTEGSRQVLPVVVE